METSLDVPSSYFVSMVFLQVWHQLFTLGHPVIETFSQQNPRVK
jgi:hypothetical protein